MTVATLRRLETFIEQSPSSTERQDLLTIIRRHIEWESSILPTWKGDVEWALSICADYASGRRRRLTREDVGFVHNVLEDATE